MANTRKDTKMKISMRLNLILGICAILMFQNAGAEEAPNLAIASPTLGKSIQKNDLIISGEFASLQSSSSSLTGVGAKVAFQVALTPRWALVPHAAQVMNTAGEGDYLFTSLGGSISYALTGSFWHGSSEVFMKGRAISKISMPRTKMWTVGAGAEQLFLNGSQSVYPAPGMAAFVGYTNRIGERWYTFSVRAGQYTSNNTPITGAMLNVATPIDF